MELIYCNNENQLIGFERETVKSKETVYIPKTTYTDIAKLNIFIGSNNSGKSRLLRHLFQNKGCFYRFRNLELKDYLWRNLRSELRDYYKLPIKKEEMIDFFFKFMDEDYIHTSTFFHDDFYFENTISEQIYNELFESKKNRAFEKLEQKHLYVPLLRGLHPIGIDNEESNSAIIDYKYTSAYRKRTLFQYFISTNDNLKEDLIFTGQYIYNDLSELVRKPSKKRRLKKEYETFLSENLFNNKIVELTASIDDKTVLVQIGDEIERPIYNLGDGIQALILLTFPIFMNKDEAMIFFIEEPEINMHPGMQRVFLKALMNLNFEKHYYFFTTHSNNFVDMVFDYENTSIFMFKKCIKRSEYGIKEIFNVENVNSRDLRILRELGVNNSSVFMSNCSIWVEGITDRLYIREYLRLYQEEHGGKKFTENMHYSFVEYGGSSISHLKYDGTVREEDGDIDIKSITNKPIIIADFDNDSKHNIRQEKLGADNYFFLRGVKEIENTLHENIVRKVVAEYEKSSDSGKDLFIDNSAFKQENYKNENLGEFIENSLKNEKIRKGSYIDSNTISYKKPFAEKACRYLREEDNYENLMSDSAHELAERLYKFIEKSNEDILSI